jgi:hypothetical protein
MFGSAITHARLMQESAQHVEDMARTGTPQEQLVADRILESPAIWTRWENDQVGLMRTVTVQRRQPLQIRALKLVCLSLIHRKALFEYLRDCQVRVRARRQILRFFHRTHAYGDALIDEHDTYLRSACSYLCSSYVGGTVILDGVFQDPLRRYEELYTEYFRVFCEECLIGDAAEPSLGTLLPYLKYQLTEQRLAVLAMPRMTPSVLRDAALRRPTGDTQKLRVDALRTDLCRMLH